jgi:hypothetical protein
LPKLRNTISEVLSKPSPEASHSNKSEFNQYFSEQIENKPIEEPKSGFGALFDAIKARRDDSHVVTKPIVPPIENKPIENKSGFNALLDAIKARRYSCSFIS